MRKGVNVTKADLIEIVARQGLTKKKSSEAVNCILESIKDALKRNDKVQIVGFGSFEVKKRAARKGRNPQTGEIIKIDNKKAPVFKPGKVLKESLNKKK